MTARKRTPARATAAANGETPDLPGRLTPTGLDLPPGLSLAEWTEVGEWLLATRSAIRWAIGDWWAYGEHAYGERAAQALDSDRWSFGSFMNMGTVARRFETSQRREVLSWSHHEAVAKLPPAQADELLDRAEAEHMSVAKVRDARRKLEAVDTTADETPATGNGQTAATVATAPDDDHTCTCPRCGNEHTAGEP